MPSLPRRPSEPDLRTAQLGIDAAGAMLVRRGTDQATATRLVEPVAHQLELRPHGLG